MRALVRTTSIERLPAGAIPVVGNALIAESFADAVRSGDTFVQLVGTPHPGPAKAAEFERVDLVSARESIRVAEARRVAHFVYLSVAQPAPVMQAYVSVRQRGEAALAASGLRATTVRPWYVLGPGHRWPWALAPLYWLAERVPATRESALRLGLVRLPDMVRALVHAVEHPPDTTVVLDVPRIRQLGRA